MQYIAHYNSPLGEMTFCSSGDALSGLWFEGQKYFGQGMADSCEERELQVFAQTRRWLDCYFKGGVPDFTPPLAPQGSAFRRAVWAQLLTIPFGETVTYGELAKRMMRESGAKNLSAQAVGGAVGHNPISVIVPCHRVVGANGSLTGYAGGIERKVRLLTLEKVDMEKLFIPNKGTAL